MSAERNVVTVTIAGEEYTLRSEATPEYTRECARYVDATIADIQRQSRGVMEPHKAAILAALSIVDQFFKANRDLESAGIESESIATRLSAKIEERLTSSDLASLP
jgi:cell division protein ZapA